MVVQQMQNYLDVLAARDEDQESYVKNRISIGMYGFWSHGDLAFLAANNRLLVVPLRHEQVLDQI